MPDASAAIEKLGAARLELLRRRTEALSTWAPKCKQHGALWQQEQPADPFDVAGVALLRRIHHERARLHLKEGHAVEALRELSADTALFDCGPSEDACREAKAGVAAAFPGICGDDDRCQYAHEWQSERTPKGSFRVIHVPSAKVKRATATGWDVTGFDAKADTYDACLGQFETDKIVGVDDQHIHIERTTWCKSIQQRRRPGLRFTYHVTSVPSAAPKAESAMLLLVEGGATKTSVQGEVQVIHVAKATVLLSNGKEGTYVANQVFPPGSMKWLYFDVTQAKGSPGAPGMCGP